MNTEDLFHTGIVVSDLELAMERLSEASGYHWTNPFAFTLPVRSGDSQQTVEFRLAYSVESPHLELVQEIPGTIWTSGPGGAVHHLGYFVDDLAAASARLTAAGFPLEACAVGKGDSPAAFAYHKDPLGMRLEIVDRAMLGDDFEEFLNQNKQ